LRQSWRNENLGRGHTHRSLSLKDVPPSLGFGAPGCAFTKIIELAAT
jgi:hypothetical protein